MSPPVTFSTLTAMVRDICPGCDDDCATTSSADTAARGGANGSAHDSTLAAMSPTQNPNRIFSKVKRKLNGSRGDAETEPARFVDRSHHTASVPPRLRVSQCSCAQRVAQSTYRPARRLVR